MSAQNTTNYSEKSSQHSPTIFYVVSLWLAKWIVMRLASTFKEQKKNKKVSLLNLINEMGTLISQIPIFLFFPLLIRLNKYLPLAKEGYLFLEKETESLEPEFVLEILKYIFGEHEKREDFINDTCRLIDEIKILETKLSEDNDELKTQFTTEALEALPICLSSIKNILINFIVAIDDSEVDENDPHYIDWLINETQKNADSSSEIKKGQTLNDFLNEIYA